jgi:hypothetical protein
MPVDSLQISDETDGASAAQPRRRGWFKKGQSGNPAGRPRGSRNRKTLLLQQLLDDEGEGLVRKAVELALSGDPTALKLCIDRVVAPRRERAVAIAVPKLKSAAELAPTMGAVLGAAADGRLTPAEAQGLAQAVATAMQAIEVHVTARRIDEIEKQLAAAEAAYPTVDPAYARISRRRGLPLP